MTTQMAPLTLLAIFFPLLWLPAVLLAGRRLGARTGWVALVAPLASAALLGVLASDAAAGAARVVSIPWIPTLGLDLTFLLDGLSLFFGLVVSGMGALIVFYASSYLDDHYEHHGRFYAYLLLFMTAMLGTVLAGNLLLLFVFWELTGIASFLLIGFLHGKAESRDGARMALLVTGATGLAMLAGIVITGLQTGTYDLVSLLSGEATPASRAAMTVAFLLVALGAMGKSAQFPFHFWLPNAMAAPTPVSAYLHSATMVKLGVFLVARIFPVFRADDLWTPLLVTVGFGTMICAALLALLSHDLKAILAYSTVTTLGMLTGFYGLSPQAGAQGDLLHIASHVFFKGALFMCAGIIDHAAGTRDVRALGGLRRHMPMLAIIVAICAASMAGIPGTLGFVSKEYFLKSVVGFLHSGHWLAAYALILATLALALKVAFSLRLFGHVFGGKEKPGTMAHFHAPSPLLLAPPALLALASLVFGLRPQWLGDLLAPLFVSGLHNPDILKLKPLPDHWALEVGLGAGILCAGALLYLGITRKAWARLSIPAEMRVDNLFDSAVHALPVGAKKLTAALRADSPFDYLSIVMAFVVGLTGAYIASRPDLWLALPSISDFDPLRTFVVGLIGVAAFLVLAMRSWTAQLIAMSIVGFLVTFYFVLFKAPDLAMTQILVEAATLVLVLLLLSRFPQTAEAGEHDPRGGKVRLVVRIVLSTGMGLLATLITVQALKPKHPDFAGAYYLNNTVELAHGTNAVNTLLVDFRGFDTLFEISVLVIATLGAVGLLMRHRRSRDEYRAGAMALPGYSHGSSFEKSAKEEDNA